MVDLHTPPAHFDMQAFVGQQNQKDLLRLLTCGSVDDGKSTLLGRLLYDSKRVMEDQLTALVADSSRFGTTGAGELDLALLVDGLAAEREQGITIDVAYRFLSTERRTFIVADAPGHEQYTRNMATAASTAELAIILVDASKGILTQTRRHSFIVGLMGIKSVVLAVNKMDLVGYQEAPFVALVQAYEALAQRLGITSLQAIPLAALTGEHVVQRQGHMPWYSGPTLLEYLESVPVEQEASQAPLRMPVQWVNRPHADFRGFAGTLAAGEVRPGDDVVVLPSGKLSQVSRIVSMDGPLQQAVAGDAVTLVLADALDVSRGDVIAQANARPEVADQFAAHLLWMSEAALLPGRAYLLRIGTAQVTAQVTKIKHKINVNTGEQMAAAHLELNDVAVCNLALDRAVPFEPYKVNRSLGGFILVDRMSHATVGCGMVDFALRRAANIHQHDMKVDRAARAAANGQRPCVLWFTGLSGSGKSTVADLVEQKLYRMQRRTMTLDGDNVRHGLNRDLGFKDEDRVENIRRIAEVAKLMVEAGLIVCVSFISPFRNERRMARELMGAGAFYEIFVDASLAVCEQRDPKGLYKKARLGEIPNFTGISSPYEAPQTPDLHLAAGDETPEQLADQVVHFLQQQGVI
ncbi:sulfate adenylyltransferase subunit 1 / adenylylsulfate kinase [Magnetococcus marinus MC-1]|uniref:Multifunctional fusion protein n=1 Tax=Magnetococcus marinus (strain ATCC BAA-1437 / JCM 17883 / MC-1) TaxID=156889 RepID=A0L6E3_MAGMM|nr:sulfate adenylyltransferase subunit CysN [Magnetococcus marinus]ABK43536.1 sulfate adenylyltransferase subunit 1 / adenylylsulfate kinase [Magnetococcus marinus MC-1]